MNKKDDSTHATGKSFPESGSCWTYVRQSGVQHFTEILTEETEGDRRVNIPKELRL